MMEDNLRYTGTKIRSVLEAQGRRQDWLAQQIGVSKSMLSLAMNGKRTLSADVAKRVASALGVPFFVLFEFPIGSESHPDRNDRSVA